ncbi:MAG: ABC transporter permease [Propionivibrio sp.]
MGRVFLLAFRNLYRQPRRTSLALLAVVFGVIALVLAGGFIEWGLWFGRDSTIHSQLGHLQIVRNGYFENGIADPFNYLLPDKSKELDRIKALEAVEAVGPRLSLSGLISLGESTISFIGDGVDPEAEINLSRSLTIRDGQSLSSGDAKGIILGQGLAANLGAHVGDSIVLLATTARGTTNAVEVHVRGIFSTVTKAYDDAALRMPIEIARKLLRVEGAHAWVVLLKETDLTSSVAEEIRMTSTKENYQVREWRDMADFYNKTETLLVKQFGVVKVIIGLIIVLSISNTMMMAVLERTGEIGTIMALGVRRRGVLQLFLAEGVVIGLTGAALGLAAGYVLAGIISYIGIPMPPAPGMADAYTARILVTGSLAIESFSLASLTTLLASFYPAWKAGRMIVVDALRANR